MNDVERIRDLIRKGEGLTTEFKESRHTLSRSVFETVCAFLNRNGGTLLLGVADTGRIIGIDPGNVSQIKKEFATTLNNPQKINPPSYLALDDVMVDGVTILRVYVPESSQVHRCGGRIFDRNEDGDFGSDTTEVTFLSIFRGEMSRRELQVELRLKSAGHFRKAYLTPALKAGLIEMTVPDKPNSRLQRYRLTEKGRKQLQKSASHLEKESRNE